MQLTSRHGTLQSFDYQHSARGVLIGTWEKGEYVRSLIQKNPGETVLFVIDEHHVPYASSARTCAKRILYAPVCDPVRARDLWKLVKDGVQRGFQAQWNIRGMPTRSEQTLDEIAVGNCPGSVCSYEGKVVASTEILDLLADKWLPKIKANGIELVGFFQFGESDVSEWGRRYKLEDGVHGDLMVSSICNLWSFRPAAYWGGMPAWKRYVDRAHGLGLKVGTWIGNHISRNAPILHEHPEWFGVGRTGKANLGGYTAMMGKAINWNTGIRAWVVDSLKKVRDEAGLDYIFIDSWGNLGMLPIHYNDGYSNNLDGCARLISELQAAGFEYIVNEGMGPLCQPRFGLGVHPTAAEGQNSLNWWIGHEDMADGLNPILARVERMDLARCFRFLANYCFVEVPEETRSLMRVWPLVRDHMYMKKRTTLSDDRGVLWTGGARSVLWSFTKSVHHTAGGMEQLYPQPRTIPQGSFTTEPLGIYISHA